MRVWGSPSTIVLQHKDNDKERICWCGRHFVYWAADGEITYQSRMRMPSNLASLKMFLISLNQKGIVEMADRWDPKPTLGFERKEHGRIIVFGKLVIQFDMEWNKLQTYEANTFFLAVQQAILMIGAQASG